MHLMTSAFGVRPGLFSRVNPGEERFRSNDRIQGPGELAGT